jgi:RHS repeat-associated protein
MVKLKGYRYGFNGKERDPASEWGQTSYDYGFRIYNPGIAKFLSVDPLTNSYPELTPYQFASNRPIDGIDLDGLERIHYLYVGNTSNGEPILQLMDKQDTRDVTVASALSFLGSWADITIKFPLEKEIVVWTQNEYSVINGPGYRFSTMDEAFDAVSNDFDGIDRFDPANTVKAEIMWLNDFNELGVVTDNIGMIMMSSFANKNLPKKWRGKTDYSELPEPRNVGPRKKFTRTQLERAKELNKRRNNGYLRDDTDGSFMDPSTQSRKGVPANPNQVEGDHRQPRNPRNTNAKPGSNSNSNLDLIRKANNQKKSNK